MENSAIDTPSTGVTYKSILSDSNGLKSNLTSNNDVSSSESNFFSGKLFRYGLIILILAFLGINLFNYLGNITNFLAGIFGPIFRDIAKFFGIAVGETTKAVTHVASSGIKTGVDIAAGTINTGANVLEKTLTGGYSKNNIDNSLNKALQKEGKQSSSEPMPDESGSTTQSNKTAKKSGFCYIGEDRGFRSCVKVNESDKCLSGDIFPSMDICINPSLRE